MATLNFEQLKELTGYKQAANIVRCLEEQGVVVFVGKNGPFTTEFHLNNSWNKAKFDTNEKIEF